VAEWIEIIVLTVIRLIHAVKEMEVITDSVSVVDLMVVGVDLVAA